MTRTVTRVLSFTRPSTVTEHVDGRSTEGMTLFLNVARPPVTQSCGAISLDNHDSRQHADWPSVTTPYRLQPCASQLYCSLLTAVSPRSPVLGPNHASFVVCRGKGKGKAVCPCGVSGSIWENGGTRPLILNLGVRVQ